MHSVWRSPMTKLPNLRRLRVENNLSQRQLAARLGVTQAAVHRWESGRSLPSAASLIALSDLFQCAPHELFPKLKTEKEVEN